MSRERGFSLLETMVALALLGLVLLAATGMVLYHPRMVRRLDAERQVYRAVEAKIEAMRGGVSLESTGPKPVFLPGSARNVTLQVTVTREPQPGLYRVVVDAEYTIYSQRLKKRVETMVWEEP